MLVSSAAVKAERREAEAEPGGAALAAAALLLISATASSRERAASRFCFRTAAASRAAPDAASSPSGCFECVGAVFVEATPGTLSADMIRKLRTPPRRAAARIGATACMVVRRSAKLQEGAPPTRRLDRRNILAKLVY